MKLLTYKINTYVYNTFVINIILMIMINFIYRVGNFDGDIIYHLLNIERTKPSF